MKKLFLLIFLCSVTFVHGQELFKSIFMKKAYENGTRTETGQPGENYWINKADYVINAELDPGSKILTGNAGITYYNQSPDTLKKLVLRVYPDIYRKGGIREFEIDSLALTSGMTFSKIILGDKQIDVSDSSKEIGRYGTNLTIKLDDPIEPGSKIKLNIDYKTKIPDKSLIRAGAYEDTSFFVSYWYPQVAVYDDVYGWDMLNYKGSTEMYNDFNNYDVAITVPKDFIVWATGQLQNPNEVLSEEFLKRYNDAFNSDSTFHIVTKEDLEKGGITVDSPKNTWVYKAENVPDFAFATAANYVWDGSGVDLKSGKRVFVDAAFRVKSEDFVYIDEIARQTIKYLSEEMPGVEYPYPSMTVFNGDGGMEYPMIINDGTTSSYHPAVHLTSHEISHTYFPFYMGTNERRFAFMDEGMVVFLSFGIQARLSEENTVLRSVERYKAYAKDGELAPPMVASDQLNGAAYRAASYSRPAMAYYFLQEMLGNDLFLKAMHEYINRWHGKHPIPYDMFYTFNEVTGQDLNWYWQKWFFDFADPDLRIKDYVNEKDNRKVVIENDGGLPVPIHLKIYYEDRDVEEIKTTAEIWKDGNTTYDVPVKNDKKITQIDLGDETVPDLYDKDSKLILNEM